MMHSWYGIEKLAEIRRAEAEARAAQYRLRHSGPDEDRGEFSAVPAKAADLRSPLWRLVRLPRLLQRTLRWRNKMQSLGKEVS